MIQQTINIPKCLKEKKKLGRIETTFRFGDQDQQQGSQLRMHGPPVKKTDPKGRQISNQRPKDMGLLTEHSKADAGVWNWYFHARLPRYQFQCPLVATSHLSMVLPQWVEEAISRRQRTSNKANRTLPVKAELTLHVEGVFQEGYSHFLAHFLYPCGQERALGPWTVHTGYLRAFLSLHMVGKRYERGAQNNEGKYNLICICFSLMARCGMHL